MNDTAVNEIVRKTYEDAEARRIRRNELMEHPETIEVGEGATYSTALGGFYRAYTVIATRRGGKELDVQRDKVTNVTTGNPYADDGEKKYEADPDGAVETITKRKDGSYIEKGQPMERWQSRYYIGYRRDWVDYSQ